MVKSDFNFMKINDSEYLITNYAGRYCFLTAEEYYAFCNGLPINDKKRIELETAFFCSSSSSEQFIQEYSNAIRTYRNYLFSGTGLHIFVLTSQCNLNCIYCQASTHQHGKKMSKEIAEKCVKMALQSPSYYLSFEFQGGEPLLNYDVLKHIVEYTESRAINKKIEFNLVSNLTLLDDEMIHFLTEHNVNISTSLDGPEFLQNKNRPHQSVNSYAVWKQKYEKLTCEMGKKSGAIQTTTRAALPYYKEIVDEYIANGISRIFLRPLTPLGYASSRWKEIGYTSEEFVEFYQNALGYIISLNKKGINISEGHASIFLDKILNHRAGNYTELISPCGAVLGQLAYNYDGNIYTCDEGRMLAEMGDRTFLVGNVDMKYKELFENPVCKTISTASCLECLPQCESCVYSPFCGTCPVLNYYENGTPFLNSPNGYKCSIYKGMLNSVFTILHPKNQDDLKIIQGWVNCN